MVAPPSVHVRGPSASERAADAHGAVVLSGPPASAIGPLNLSRVSQVERSDQANGQAELRAELQARLAELDAKNAPPVRAIRRPGRKALATVTFRLPEDLLSELDMHRAHSGWSRSEYVRQALEETNAAWREAAAQARLALEQALSALAE